MPYIIAQNLLYLLLAVLLGGLIAWLFGLCKCKGEDLHEELEGAKAERDALAERLARVGNANNISSENNEIDAAKVKSLQAQLDAANAKIANLEASGTNTAVGLAGAGVGLTLKDNEVAIDSDELATIKSRNKFLETRIKFLDEDHNAAKKPSKEDFTPSNAVSMTPEELEDLVIAAGEGNKPNAVERGADADDLLLIEGVGPKNNKWLNENGIHYFWQIATMNPSELAWIANNLPKFGTRVYRENWVKQSANLAKGLPARH
jgi:predicted flap endonuclease-1-like 5' DNA nuclease